MTSMTSEGAWSDGVSQAERGTSCGVVCLGSHRRNPMSNQVPLLHLILTLAHFSSVLLNQIDF